MNSKLLLIISCLICASCVVTYNIGRSPERFSIPTTGFFTQLGAVTTIANPPASFNQGGESARGIVVNPATGDIYVAAETTGSVAEVNAAPGTYDIVLLKYNYLGVLQWAKQFGSLTKIQGTTVAANQGTDRPGALLFADGYLYLTGATSGEFAEVSGGNWDLFWMKLELDGDVVWAKQLGQSTTVIPAPINANQGLENSLSAAFTPDGNIVIGAQTNGNVAEVNAGGTDIFAIKINKADGSVMWGTQLGQSTIAVQNPVNANQGNDGVHSVAAGANGIYLVGGTEGNMGEVNALITNNDGYIVRLTHAGALDYVLQFGGATTAPGNPANANQSHDWFRSVSVDAQDNLYIVGYTSGNFQEVGGGGYDIFALKTDDEGNVSWAKQFGATTSIPGAPATPNAGADLGMYSTIDSQGNVFLTGQTSGAFVENPSTNGDIVVVKLKGTDGDVSWAKQFGGTTRAPVNPPALANQGFDSPNVISRDSVGNIYVGGFTQGDLSEANANSGTRDLYIFKLNSSGSF